MIGKRHFLLLAVCIATAGFLELGLRFLRFSVDRWIGACEPGTAATTPLNHGPNAGRALQRLGSADVYGQFAGWEYEENFDERGIKRSALRPQDGEGTRILFMGDSFIQGYDDANTIPQRAYEWMVAHRSSTPPLIVLNAAYSSYSPVIFTVQAKHLLPTVRPDFVVVDIDETDIFDDAVRYRGLVVRDAGGSAVAVDRNPALRALAEGSARARCYPLYLVRLTAALYFQLRIAVYDWRERRSQRLFAVAETPEGNISPELREQMQYFSTTLDELFTTLKEFLPAERILVVRHPHLWHLKYDKRGPSWNRKVGELVGAAAARNGISFFDAQDELAARFADHPQRYYWKVDMHFNFDGMRAYGELVGRELLRKMEGAGSARSSKNSSTDTPPKAGAERFSLKRPSAAHVARRHRRPAWRGSPTQRSGRHRDAPVLA